MAIKFEASGDFSQLLAENQKYQAQLVKMTQQVDQLQRSVDSMGRAAKKGGQEFAAAGTPMGEYQRTVAKLSKDLANGEISQSEFAKSVAEADAKYDAAAKTLDKTSNQIEPHKAKLSSLGGQVAKLAAGYMSWQAGLQLAGDALRYVQQETEKAKGSQDALVDQRRALVQVASDEGDLQQMIARADAAAAKFGVARETAYQVMFQARSEGFETQYEDVMRFAPVVAPTSAAGVAGQVPGLFKQTEALTSEQAISGTLLAAQQSRLSFEEIARAMPQAAEGMAIAKGSFAETAGVLSVLASRFKSGETAADRIKAFTTKLGISEEFGGRGLVGGFEALQAADAETRAEFLGDSNELNAVFQILSEELPTVKARIAAVASEVKTAAGGGESLAERQVRVALSDPAERARIERMRAGIEREQANERQFAEAGSLRQAAIDRELAAMKDVGQTGFSQWGAEKAGRAAELAGAGPTLTTGVTQVGGLLTSSLFGPIETAKHLFGMASDVRERSQELREQTAETRKTREATERQTAVLQGVADQLANAPRSGTSAAASAPNLQRQGR